MLALKAVAAAAAVVGLLGCRMLQGPIISREQSGSVSVGFMKGILESPLDKEFKGSWIVNDVRDVALAHILAAEKPQAKGRWAQLLPALVCCSVSLFMQL